MAMDFNGQVSSSRVTLVCQKMPDEYQKAQKEAEAHGVSGGVSSHIAVIGVAAVNFDPWSSVALAVSLAAEGFVRARLHYAT